MSELIQLKNRSRDKSKNNLQTSVAPLEIPLKGIEELETSKPRALRSLSQIINNGLCHRCGSCVGICPTNVLGLDEEEFPTVKNFSACTDCDLCVKVCPGEEFDVPTFSKELFGEVPDIHDMHGHFEESYVGYAIDPEIRGGSTSGGIVSGLLVDLLERGLIDGAVVIVSDKEEPWKGKPILAKDRATILSAMKSKYAISPTNIILQEIIQNPGRYVLVGLPCQIHGFQKAAKLNRKLQERVVLTVGLFCHAAVEHDAIRYIWETQVPFKNKVKRFISRVGKHPGTPYTEDLTGNLKPVYFPNKKGYRPSSLEILNILYRLYTPPRCLTCYDSTSEFADIAVGDPWMAPPAESVDFSKGYTFALARTKRGVEALKNSKGLDLHLLEREHAKTSNRMMGEEKRNRAFRVVETHQRQGRPTPDYGVKLPILDKSELLKTELNMFTHLLCFFDGRKKWVLKLTFSPVGYWLLRLNYYRRQFRIWLRDSRYKNKLKSKDQKS